MNCTHPNPSRLIVALLIGCYTLMFAGCGQVAVFGHTIGEKQSASKDASETTAPAPAQAEPKATKVETQSSSEKPVFQSSPKAASSGPKQAPAGAESSQLAPQPQKLQSVSVSLTQEAAAKAAQDPRFSTDALLAAIKNELRARGILDEAGSQAAAEFVIEEYALNPTSNAIVFGQIISNGVLNGTVHVRDSQGKEAGAHRIEAKARVSVSAKGESKDPLGSLNRQFAVQAGDAISGVVTKTDGSDQWRPR